MNNIYCPGPSLMYGGRYVEEQYNLEIGNAQVTQLSKAITSGAEKNIFALPKGENLHG